MVNKKSSSVFSHILFTTISTTIAMDNGINLNLYWKCFNCSLMNQIDDVICMACKSHQHIWSKHLDLKLCPDVVGLFTQKCTHAQTYFASGSIRTSIAVNVKSTEYNHIVLKGMSGYVRKGNIYSSDIINIIIKYTGMDKLSRAVKCWYGCDSFCYIIIGPLYDHKSWTSATCYETKGGRYVGKKHKLCFFHFKEDKQEHVCMEKCATYGNNTPPTTGDEIELSDAASD